jgi:hypothetical protein
MEPQCTTITIRRSDLPPWLPSVCGEVFLDDKRVARLIGGQPRTIWLTPGHHLLRVRLPVGWPRLQAARSIDVAEGGSYRFECGLIADDRARRPAPPLLLAMATGPANEVALVGLPLFRAPVQVPACGPDRGLPGPGHPFRLLDLLVAALVHPLCVMAITYFGLFPTVPISQAALSRCRIRCYLGEESGDRPLEKPEDFPPGTANGGPLDLWDPILDPPAASGIWAGTIARSA